MIVTIDLPDALANVDPRSLKEALIAVLYNTDKLSEREARQALEMTRREFQDMLPRYGASVLADTPENLAIELRAGDPFRG